MYHQMENAFAHVEVDELGAQLHSLRRRKDGYEYLWQGDPAIWPGQAPILFPIVGMNCQAYRQGNHWVFQVGFKSGFIK